MKSSAIAVQHASATGKKNDDPMLAHKHVTPNCDFLLKNSEVNYPINISDESDVITRLKRLENDQEFNSQVFNETSTEANERLDKLLPDCTGVDKGTDDDLRNLAVTSDYQLENTDADFGKNGIAAGSVGLPTEAIENRKDADRPNKSKIGHNNTNGNIPDFVTKKAVQPSDYSRTDVTRGVPGKINSASNINNRSIDITTRSQCKKAKAPSAKVARSPISRSTQILTAAKAVADNPAAAPSKSPKRSTRAARVATFRKSHRIAASGNSTVSKTACNENIPPKLTQEQCRTNQTDVTVQPQTLSERTSQYPEYSSTASRIASFGHTEQIAIRIEQLCDAGFFYIGCGDETRCFFCGIGLGNWAQDDDPMGVHARYSSECPFVLANKDRVMK